MIAFWIKFWATLGNGMHFLYNGSLVGRVKSDTWVMEALVDIDLVEHNKKLKELGLYLE